MIPRNTTLRLTIPSIPFQQLKCTLYLCSDSCIGLDQQYDFILDTGDSDEVLDGEM